MKPFTFTPQPSRLPALFAEWVPMYIGQARMDDDEAEPFQQPLCDLEKAIDDRPITTLQDFFVKHTVVTCFGSMAADYNLDDRDIIHAAAMAAAKERESLLALINEHIANEAKFEEVLDHHETGTPEFQQAGGDELSSRGINLMLAIAAHPATSFETVMLKGRYFASRHANGDLGRPEAFAFAASFSDNAEGV